MSDSSPPQEKRHKSKFANMLDPRVDYNAAPSTPAHPPPPQHGYTTTTTTTTTSRYSPELRGDTNARPSPYDPPSETANAPAQHQRQEGGTDGTTPLPDQRTGNDLSYDAIPIPPRSERRRNGHSPTPPVHPTPSSTSTPATANSTIKRKPSPVRPSAPSPPYANTHADQAPSPTNPNFSRPTPMGLTGGIKAAAAGIHGAGETLRGTFNASVDRHMHEPEHVTARHDAVASAGKNEIRTGQRHESETQKLSGLGKLRKKHYEGDGAVSNNVAPEESAIDDSGAHERGSGGGMLGRLRKQRVSGEPVSGTPLERVDEHNRLI